MWNFSNTGLIIIYPQDLLGYKNVAVLLIFFRSVKCYLVFHSFWDKEQNFIMSQNRSPHHCKLSLQATLSCILTANSCWKKKVIPIPVTLSARSPCKHRHLQTLLGGTGGAAHHLGLPAEGQATHWKLLTLLPVLERQFLVSLSWTGFASHQHHKGIKYILRHQVESIACLLKWKCSVIKKLTNQCLI